MFPFSVQQIVLATDNSGSSLNLSNSNRTLSTVQNTSFGSLLKELEKLRTENAEIRKENAEIRQENTEIRKDNTEIRNENAEIRKENAEIRKDNDKIRKADAEIRKENADLQAQVVSDGVNHTTFSLSIPLCSSLL